MTLKTPDIYGEGAVTVTVGLCQVGTVRWDLEGNLARTLAAIEAAAEQGAEMAVTPECVLHAYGEHDDPRAGELLAATAQRVDSAVMRRLYEQVATLGIYAVIGFAETDGAGRFYNSAVLVGPGGAVVDVYRKVHCRDFERVTGSGLFTPGEAFKVTEIRIGGQRVRVGLMICFDREIAETVRCLRALGAELVLCPLATDTSDMRQRPEINGVDNEVITRCRAAENEVFIVVVNHAERFNGGSFVVGPSGELVTQIGSAAAVEVCALPVSGVRAAFHGDALGWMGWGYRRGEVYGRYLLDNRRRF